jgi:hypothetical protein
MLPFCLLAGVPLLVLPRVTGFPLTSNGLHIWLLVAFLTYILPEVSMRIPHRSLL